MSYYAGDFYQGDPGFLSFLGKGLSFLPGIGGAIGKVVSKVGASRVGQAVMKHPVLSAAGGAGAAGAGAGMLMRGPGTGMPMMGTPASLAGRMPGAGMPGVSARGYHLSKPRKCGGMLIPPHLVRNRRMRVTNPRALRRAIRRARGFERVARKVMHFVSPRKTRGRAVFRARRRK